MHHTDTPEGQTVITIEVPAAVSALFESDPAFRERFIWGMRSQGVPIVEVKIGSSGKVYNTPPPKKKRKKK